ncbi:MAG: glycosyl hydrolase, partial [Acidobacteriota bacterium]
MVWLLLLLPALVLAQAGEKESSEEEKDPPKMSAGTFSSFELRGIGPALMSGRVSDIAIDPRDQSTWYVGVGSGGVWKTTNAGTTWTPIFDAQSVYSIGEITLDPQRPDTVWVGSGENVGGRHVSFGDGIYRSRDGGQSWENLGLENSEHIGSIVVHPEDSNVVWVAAQGPLWSPGGDRGVFKTTDGGETWNKVLGGETPDEESYTGANEVVIDPANPDVLYAALHHKFRDVAALINAGPESAIYKSVDGGENWRKLSNGLPGEDMGKIGLAVSPHNSDVVYATIELAAREGGFYRSTDAGESWEKRNDYISGGTGPHYYQEIFADPHRFDRVYQMDARMRVTNDGGLNFEVLEGDFKHVDNHALGFDPDDPDYLLVGCDGGLYETFDNGDTWKYVANLPVTQFYKVAVDVDAPFYNVYGGTQDNSTQGGPSRTSNIHGIRNSDWFLTLFGDGHQPATDPENPDIVYSEWQQGNMVRYDRKTGEIVYIQPQPGPGEPAERWNWDSPIIVSPHDPARIYFASQRLWRSDDRGDSWRPVSGDLSRGEDRLTRPMMGRVWSIDAAWDLWAMSYYGNITSISESPVVEGLLYAGTDDGLVQVSEDGGENWRQAGALPDVPEYAFVNDIKADLHDADTVYVALDHHKSGDYRPFLLKSADRGVTWTSIAGDPEDGGIPDKHLVWRLVQDHEKPELLFVGTEFGVFFSVEGGNSWIELNGGVPTIAWRDLAIQKRENDLVGATFGRGFYIFDDYTPLREVSE